jgi:hypothetical protein
VSREPIEDHLDADSIVGKRVRKISIHVSTSKGHARDRWRSEDEISARRPLPDEYYDRSPVTRAEQTRQTTDVYWGPWRCGRCRIGCRREHERTPGTEEDANVSRGHVRSTVWPSLDGTMLQIMREVYLAQRASTTASSDLVACVAYPQF